MYKKTKSKSQRFFFFLLKLITFLKCINVSITLKVIATLLGEAILSKSVCLPSAKGSTLSSKFALMGSRLLLLLLLLLLLFFFFFFFFFFFSKVNPLLKGHVCRNTNSHKSHKSCIPYTKWPNICQLYSFPEMCAV